ncbi:hypothetical protein GT755_30945 [Herbidospora sp. NEAU-GS84]|uniref:Uncharacterized protein n=1 Tax=Herbidospora solisilvae TaxID=2696284 RepID=A0A7C9NS44_9ACTN|nr:hypothetical protein [Herbidospora solisilvae]NAS26076.1 hypothetical protein [Herbidospora solisilvae]
MTEPNNNTPGGQKASERSATRNAFIGAAATIVAGVLAAVIALVPPLLKDDGAATPPTAPATTSATPSPATSPATVAPVVDPGSPEKKSDGPCPLAEKDNRVEGREGLDVAAVIDGVAAEDGRPGVGSDMRVCVTIKAAPAAGHDLWLVLRLEKNEGVPNPVYFAKARLPREPGVHAVRVQSPCATPRPGPRPRTLMVVSADEAGSAELARNQTSDRTCDRTYEVKRVSLPAGVDVISSRVFINRTE